MDYYLSMKAKRSSHYIEVKESRVMVKIPIDTILYTDYFNHYIQIHLADRIVKTYMRFEDFSKLLLCYPQFISCYRNCIINLDKVVRLEKPLLSLRPVNICLLPEASGSRFISNMRIINSGR